MRRTPTSILAFTIIAFAVFWSLYGTIPQDIQPADSPETEFSTERAFQHVQKMAEEPHYLGSRYHSRVRNYLVNELQEMGLYVQTQEGYALNKYGIIAKPQNIISRIEGSGNGKALLLLSHYDSAMHSSYGASDAASGVATVLEGIRAFLAEGFEHENDIIIVFTDAEELGLNGAELFINDHPWAKEIGLALNFESRGSGGNSFMLLETTKGNKELIKNFKAAGLEYPVTNSLAYSIYKMLPNDTDLTVLREQGEINGFNFAFIDDHFDYHTATDVPENLDKPTLAHQGSYLMPLLKYFSNGDLDAMESEADSLYFNFPVLKMFSYPFSWIFPMLIVAVLLFLAVLLYGFKKKILSGKSVGIGFAPLFLSLFVAGVLSFLLWKACLLIYPEYSEMEHGFTYNGYKYIITVLFLALAISFFSYRKFVRQHHAASLFVAPLLLWILISTGAAFFLKGASYFIIPVFFGLVQLFLLIKYKHPNLNGLALLSLPAIFIVMPFVPNFPVALGLRILFVAAIMAVLLFVLLLPIFLFWKNFKMPAMLCWLVSFLFFIIAHFQSDFNEERPKPNSLVYLLDADANTASWNTYDELLDSYTENFIGENRERVNAEMAFSSKYNSGFTFSSPAPTKKLAEPYISISKNDSTTNGKWLYNLKVAPNRTINRMDFFADKNFNFQNIKVNGLEAGPVEFQGEKYHVFNRRFVDNLLTYYASTMDTLRLEIEVNEGETPELLLYETSHDLLENDFFSVPARSEEMIPKPFIINDAVIIKKRIKLE